MPNEPLLTRKSYKEQLEKQNRELEELEEKQSRRDSRLSSFEREEEFQSEHEEESVQVHRTPKIRAQKVQSFLKRMACFSSGSFNYHSCDSNVLLE